LQVSLHLLKALRISIVILLCDGGGGKLVFGQCVEATAKTIRDNFLSELRWRGLKKTFS